MSEPVPISVIVPTGNRIDVIEDCLKSVRWADEVIVVDSFSTDGTLDVARKYADRVLQHEYGFSARQKNWAIPQASHEWVLIVDTDERVTAQLRDEIRETLRLPSPYVGYRIPRLNFLLGEPLHHTGYYPDYQVRLFRRDQGRYQLRRVHAHVLLDGPSGTIQSPLVHYAHRSLDQTIHSLLLGMTTWEAEQIVMRDRKPRIGLFLTLLLRPPAAFLLRYVRQGGWRDGYRGLVTSLLWAIYVAITHMKVWEHDLSLPQRWWVDEWQERQLDMAMPEEAPQL